MEVEHRPALRALPGSRGPGSWAFLAVIVATALVAALAGAAGGRGATALSLDVTFSSDDAISVTLPDGTPVGATSGVPTVIPAGYYTILISGPMGLPSGLPYFHLTGPGVDLLSNLNEGGLESVTANATFLPSSTYVWTDDAIPGVVNTFRTSADVLGAPPTTPSSPRTGPPAQGQDLVGSDIVPLRGTLAATISAAGRLNVELDGEGAGRLPAGRYRISVTDMSATRGCTLTRAGRPVRSITGAAYVGKHSVTVDLTPGRWSLGAGTKAYR